MAHGFSDNKEKVEITDALEQQISAVQQLISTLQTQVNTVQSDVRAVQGNVTTLQTNVSAVQTKANTTETNLNNYWKTIYPVGAIYMSTSPTNPALLVGGTWVAWGSGRVPVGVNTSDSDFNTVEKTGGEKKHRLTISEMPSHSHEIRVMADSTTGAEPYVKSGENSQETTADTQPTGGGAAHNNLQPYITCYMFKRTA